MPIKNCKFQRSTNGFDYYFEEQLEPGEKLILQMPRVSPNKRGVNDIGWQTDIENRKTGDVVLYATLSYKPESKSAIWTEIEDYDEVNKTISYIRIENNDSVTRKVAIKALLN